MMKVINSGARFIEAYIFWWNVKWAYKKNDKNTVLRYVELLRTQLRYSPVRELLQRLHIYPVGDQTVDLQQVKAISGFAQRYL